MYANDSANILVPGEVLISDVTDEVNTVGSLVDKIFWGNLPNFNENVSNGCLMPKK
jgi:hypothetical protein